MKEKIKEKYEDGVVVRGRGKCRVIKIEAATVD